MEAKRAKYPTDQDGKSKTASGVDQAHYPEQHEAPAQQAGGRSDGVSLDPDEIARHAFNLWMQRGRPDGSSELDWYEAEEQLRRSLKPGSLAPRESGSVQS